MYVHVLKITDGPFLAWSFKLCLVFVIYALNNNLNAIVLKQNTTLCYTSLTSVTFY
jgi:hypothetical protein